MSQTGPAWHSSTQRASATPSILGVHSCPLCLSLLPTSLPATASPPAPAPQPRGHQPALGPTPSSPSLCSPFSQEPLLPPPQPHCAHLCPHLGRKPRFPDSSKPCPPLTTAQPSALAPPSSHMLGAGSSLCSRAHAPRAAASQPLVSGTVLTQHVRSTCPRTAPTAGTPGCSQGHIGHF